MILADTSGEGDERGTDSQMAKAREMPGQTNIEVRRNQLEREALRVDRGAFGRCGVYVRRAWNRGWWVTMESDVEGFAESEVRVHGENRVAD